MRGARARILLQRLRLSEIEWYEKLELMKMEAFVV